MIYRSHLKRSLDIILALVAIVLLALPLLVAMAVICMTSPGPVFFMQKRVGLGGRTFRIIKLRTMTVNTKRELTQTTNADPEVFAAGRVLRRLKIDELPQLFNVLRGDMSFVGPRPCLEQTWDEMPDWARRRFDVRPGITGLAQINGNIALTWPERWKHDVEYVDSLSFFLDIKVVFKTFLVVLLGEDRFRKTI